MKDSSCHDPKMEAYCKAVRRLEDKFDGLELNQISIAIKSRFAKKNLTTQSTNSNKFRKKFTLNRT